MLKEELGNDYYMSIIKIAHDIISTIYYILNPFTLFYMIFFESISKNFGLPKYSFYYYNFNPIFLIHFFVFMTFFLSPTSLIKKRFSSKKKFLTFLNTSPVEIGDIYSTEVLKKYYEIKKLQLFNLIIDCNKNEKKNEDYYNLMNNYLLAIKYLKRNIDKKINKEENIIKIDLNVFNKEFSPLKDENENKNNYLLIGDISYNQSFISKYEIYSNYSLMKNL